jgi:hypothetical protein
VSTTPETMKLALPPLWSRQPRNGTDGVLEQCGCGHTATIRR